jgi:hypothetical protein
MLGVIPARKTGGSQFTAPSALVPRGLESTRALPRPLTLSGNTFRRIVLVSRTPDAAVRGDAMVFAPVAVPLVVAGMGPRTAQALEQILDRYGVLPVQGGGAGHLATRAALEPGSAMGVQLMRGDVNLTAIGTVTYRRGASILGFGHAFLNKGGVEFLLTPAVIHEVVRSVATPFKIGSPGAVMGAVREDRRAGIGGETGVIPKTIAIRVTVRDVDRKTTTRLGMHAVRDPELGPAVALLGVLEAFDRALDRVGGGTANLRLTMRGQGLPDVVVRTNVFYHGKDVSVGALVELPEALRILFRNEFVAVEPVDLTIEADVSRDRHTAAVVRRHPPAPPRARRRILRRLRAAAAVPRGAGDAHR